MMTLEQIRKSLSDRRLHKVAEATGVHYNTVRHIASGKTRNPSWDVMRRLDQYLGAGRGEESAE